MDTKNLKSKRKVDLKNRIHRVGIELEGGWDAVPKGMRVERDGSVIFPNAGQRVNALSGAIEVVGPKHIGEIPGPQDGLDISEVDAYIKKYYPKYVNETCGLHVHMSFKYLLNYQRLMTPDYTKEMIKKLLEWSESEKLPKKHPMWERLTNPNHPHCAHIYLGDNQVKQTRKDFHSRGTAHSRYTAVNYCRAQHGTVECRLLPMMETADQACRAVHKVLDTTNKFLSKIRQKELKRQIAVKHGEPYTLNKFVRI